MTLLPILLLVAGSEPVALPGLTIDPCVQVDAEEVRRLAAIELSSGSGAPVADLEVTVSCSGGLEEVRLIDRAHDRVTVRSIDLGATETTDRDAKARELSLVIAELLRRAAAEQAAARSAPKPAAPPPPSPPVVKPPPPPVEEERHFAWEVGLSGVVVGWTGGEVWLGADVSGRAHVGRWLILELAAGGRKTRSLELTGGTLAGYGAAGRVGLSLDVMPDARSVGLAVGASFNGDWLRYEAVDRNEVEYGGGSGGALSLAGTATGFVALGGPWCLTLRTAVGGAVHSIGIRNNGQRVSGARGAVVSGAFGVAARF